MSDTHFWISVARGTRRMRLVEYVDHSALWRAHVIEYTLRVADGSYVHVGSGRTSIYDGKPLSLHCRVSQSYVIPGSTLKGAVAHYYTAIFRDMRETSYLFGWPGYMSRVLFSDAKTEAKPEPLGVGPSWTPRIARRGIKIYRQGIQLERIDEPVQYVEAFPGGTTFTGRLVILNWMIDETAKLLLAMGATPQGNATLLIGFGKPKGLGKVVLQDFKVLSVDQRGMANNVTQEISSKLEKVYQNVKDPVREVFGIG